MIEDTSKKVKRKFTKEEEEEDKGAHFKPAPLPNPLHIIIAFQWAIFGLLLVLWHNDFIIWQGPDRPDYRIIPNIINETAKVFYIKDGELHEDNFLVTYQYEEEKATAILERWAALLWQEKLIHQLE